MIAYTQTFKSEVNSKRRPICVNIDIPYAIYDPIHSKADFQPGVHCLSGPWVLAFVRVRQNTANSDRTTDF